MDQNLLRSRYDPNGNYDTDLIRLIGQAVVLVRKSHVTKFTRKAIKKSSSLEWVSVIVERLRREIIYLCKLGREPTIEDLKPLPFTGQTI